MPADTTPSGELAAWAASRRIECILPGDGDRYDAARRVFNRMHDRFPAAVLWPATTDDVRMVLDRTRALGLPLVVRGGGHHIAGRGTCDDGVVLDLGRMRRVELLASGRRCHVGGGARLRDLDGALCPRGAVIPTGTVSDTGVGGLTLGGGIGWMLGRAGLTCDNLVGAEVVLADGTVTTVHDDDGQVPDLLWALRGGGGGFGIVTRFEFRTHELPPVTVGAIRVPDADARRALLELVEFLDNCPRALTVAPVLVAPAGELELLVEFCLTGEDDSPVRALRRHVPWGEFDVEADASFAAWQRHTDVQFAEPMRGYWKSAYIESLGEQEIDAVLEAARAMPTPASAVLVEHLHGAFHDHDEQASAFPLRDASFGVLFSSRWVSQDMDEVGRSWARDAVHAVDPDGRSGSYSNYTSVDDPRSMADFQRSEHVHERLAGIKRAVDPDGVFGRAHLDAVQVAG